MTYSMLSSALALAVATTATTAHAQDASTASSAQAAVQPEAETSGGITEIIVTAQKRNENVQDVPIAISVFTSDALRERTIGEVSQLANITPNVSLDAGTPFSGSSSILAAYIRGIGANDFAMNLDPGVGVYLDGIYLARNVGANLDLPDVGRIEILKGPQGTLFGRNTIGGAISIVTRDPGKDFAFQGDVTTGRFGRLDVRGSADLPLTGDLRAMVTFSMKNRDGYQKRIPYPGLAQFDVEPLTAFRNTGYDTSTRGGGQDEWSLRGKLLWEASDRLTMRLTGDYMKMDQSAMPSSMLAVLSGVPGPFAGTANIPGTALDPTATTGFFHAGLYNFCIGSTTGEIAARGAAALCGPRGTPLNPSETLPGFGSVNVDADPGNDRLPYDARWVSTDKDKSFATGINFSKMTSWGLAHTIEFDLSDAIQLKSITGYRDLAWRSGIDLDNSPLQMLENSFSLKQWQVSQEVQLIGQALDKRLNYVLGGYYFKEKGNMEDYVILGEGLLQIGAPNDLATTNYAFFGQVDWRLSDLIGFTAGARYTHESKRFTGGIYDLNGFNYKLFNCPVYGDPCSTALGFPDPAQPLRYYTPEEQRRTFTNFSPKVGVQLHPTDDVMIYGSWSRGYKTGGWTTRLTNPLPFAPDFDEEKAESWEVGVKTMMLDRRLQINAAAFTTRYDGIQLNFQQGISPTIENAGDARIRGFEVEMVAAPVTGLTITGALGYVDAYFTSVAPAAAVAPSPLQAGVFKGAPLPKTPNWKANISPRYEIDLGDTGSIVLVADYTWTSSQWNDTERTFLLRRNSTDIVNASISYRAPSSNWDVTVGATNLTGERYIVTGLTQIAGGIFGSWSAPAEWYARLGVKF